MEKQGEFRESLKETDWAWLAGFIDGEGHLSIRRSYAENTNATRRTRTSDGWTWYSARVSVHNTHQVAIERAAAMMDGVATKRRKQAHNVLDIYSVEVSARLKVQEILQHIVPYMIVKRDMALLILDFVRLPHGSGPLKQEMHERAVILSQAGERKAA
jgi:hypothetical protein